jgi:hypothetical protein
LTETGNLLGFIARTLNLIVVLQTRVEGKAKGGVIDRIRIIPNALRSISDCGSFEVWFAEGRESPIFLLGRQPWPITQTMDRQQAREAARKLPGRVPDPRPGRPDRYTREQEMGGFCKFLERNAYHIRVIGSVKVRRVCHGASCISRAAAS